MIISAIVAKAANNAIGINNKLPWHLPNDLKWFKKHTLGHHVIMGRKSFESLGKPLPKRTNIIITRDHQFFHSDCIAVRSIDEALLVAHKNGEKEVFILGGGQIYKQTKTLWDRIYITEVDASPAADTHFPQIDLSDYILIFEEPHPSDEKHEFQFTFKVFEHKRCKFS